MYKTNFSSVTRALTRLLQLQVLKSHPDVTVHTDIPDQQFREQLGQAPALNLYLTGLRQSFPRRMSDVLSPAAATASPSPNTASFDRRPRVIELSYMITAWSKATKDHAITEQSLLYTVVQGLTAHPELPPALYRMGDLPGPDDLIVGDYPVLIDLMLDKDSDVRSGDYWSALGSAPRPLVELTVTIPLAEGTTITLPVVHKAKYDTQHKTPQDTLEPPLNPTLSGTITAPFPPDQLQVKLIALDEGKRYTARPDINGDFAFTTLPPGDYVPQLVPYDKKLKAVSLGMFTVEDEGGGVPRGMRVDWRY
ncbi:Pvc16 family protein [Iodobacter fluviatilis]|nr:Pvc16 family protein [Iodobacter fluviatilis]